MRTRGALLFPVAVALVSGSAPASATYTEQWISNAELAHAQTGVAAHKNKIDKHAVQGTPSSRHASLQTATKATDDDPIAAFARNPHSSSNSRAKSVRQ